MITLWLVALLGGALTATEVSDMFTSIEKYMDSNGKGVVE